jgi:hypothetical protein
MTNTHTLYNSNEEIYFIDLLMDWASYYKVLDVASLLA